MRLNDEQRKLVEQNHNLIYSAMYKFGIRNEKFDDYYGVAAVGLCKAGMHFNIFKGSFSTVAYKCIHSELRKQIRDDNALYRKSDRDSVSYNATIFQQEDNSICTENILLVDENFEENLISTLLFLDKLEILYNIDKKIIALVIYGYTQEEIGKALGISRQAVQQHIYRMRHREFKNL